MNTVENWQRFPVRSAIESSSWLGIVLGTYKLHSDLLFAMELGALAGITICIASELIGYMYNQQTGKASSDEDTVHVPACIIAWGGLALMMNISSREHHWLVAGLLSTISGIMCTWIGQLCLSWGPTNRFGIIVNERVTDAPYNWAHHPIRSLLETAVWFYATWSSYLASNSVFVSIGAGAIAGVVAILCATILAGGQPSGGQSKAKQSRETTWYHWGRPCLRISMLLASMLVWDLGSSHKLACLVVIVGAVTLGEWLSHSSIITVPGELDSAASATKPSTEAVVKSVDGKLPNFTIEDVRKHSDRDDCWIVIENCVYDVTKWAPQHPGGQLPLWGVAGRDATDHFYAFHPRGNEKRLKPLLIGNLVGYKPSEVILEFRALRQRLVDEGVFDIKAWYFVLHFVIFIGMLLAAVLCVEQTAVSSCPYLWTVAGAVLLGFFWQQIAGLGHDGGHNSVTHVRDLDFRIGMVTGNLLTGISVGWWKKSHNTHHTVTNSIEHDPDIQHLPAFAINEKYFDSILSKYHDWRLTFDRVAKFLVSYQHFLYLPIMAFARFNLYAQSVLYVAGFNSHNHTVNGRLVEAISLAGFFGWLTWLCLMLPSALHILVFLILSHNVAGLLHVQITISHFSMDVYEGVAFKDDDESWLHTQVATTMDVDCPSWLDWFHIGLQFQLEHHLFPRVPRHNLRMLQGLIIEFCKKHNLQHVNLPWSEAIIRTLRHMQEVAVKAREASAIN